MRADPSLPQRIRAPNRSLPGLYAKNDGAGYAHISDCRLRISDLATETRRHRERFFRFSLWLKLNDWGNRQADRECGTPAHFTVDLDRAMVLPDHAVGHRKAHADAHAHSLCGEAGIEDLVLKLPRNAGSRVADGDDHLARLAAGLDEDLPRFLDRLAGVVQHVHERLVQQSRVTPLPSRTMALSGERPSVYLVSIRDTSAGLPADFLIRSLGIVGFSAYHTGIAWGLMLYREDAKYPKGRREFCASDRRRCRRGCAGVTISLAGAQSLQEERSKAR